MTDFEKKKDNSSIYWEMGDKLRKEAITIDSSDQGNMNSSWFVLESPEEAMLREIHTKIVIPVQHIVAFDPVNYDEAIELVMNFLANPTPQIIGEDEGFDESGI